MARRITDWEIFADGEVHVLRQGIDFDVEPSTFTNNARKWCSTWGYECETRTMAAGTVILRMSPQHLRGLELERSGA